MCSMVLLITTPKRFKLSTNILNRCCSTNQYVWTMFQQVFQVILGADVGDYQYTSITTIELKVTHGNSPAYLFSFEQSPCSSLCIGLPRWHRFPCIRFDRWAVAKFFEGSLPETFSCHSWYLGWFGAVHLEKLIWRDWNLIIHQLFDCWGGIHWWASWWASVAHGVVGYFSF